MIKELTFSGPTGEQLPASLSLPADADTVFVMGHGSGSNKDVPLLLSISNALAKQRIACLRFNYPYSAKSNFVPFTDMPINDRPTLLKSFTAAVDLAIKTVPELKILCGGHSMSALVATVADATEVLPVSGVIAMGYPRKGDPELSAHIPDTHSRLLVIQGTNDDLGSVEEIAMMAKTTNTPATIKWIENADHKFDVPGQPRASVAQDIATSIRQFSDAI